jgi:hypothetical protein
MGSSLYNISAILIQALHLKLKTITVNIPNPDASNQKHWITGRNGIRLSNGQPSGFLII